MRKLLHLLIGTFIATLLLFCISFANDTRGLIIEGRTLVPVRGVFEELGFNVIWDAETQTAFLADSNYTVKIQKGAGTFTTNTKIITPEIPQQVISDSFYLPLRAIADSIGAETEWDNDNKIAIIHYNDKTAFVFCGNVTSNEYFSHNDLNSDNVESSAGSGETTTETTTEAENESTTEEGAVIGGADGETDITVVSFSDVEDNFWGRSYITELASKGVVNGYPDGTFRPNDNVKRADFLIMLLRGLGVDTSAAATGDNFTDVEAGAYYANACAIAKEMGIATGNPDGSFAPNSFITRQDMMILAKKALESELGSEITGDVSVLDQFNDKAEISAYAVDSLAAMVEQGIVSGMGDGIAPKDNTTRAQAAVIISKIMENIG